MKNKDCVNLYSTVPTPVTTANGSIMNATATGIAQSSSGLSLDNVLVCPSATENLLSIASLDKLGYSVVFGNGEVKIGKGGSLDKVINSGTLQNMAYYLDLDLTSPNSTLPTATTSIFSTKALECKPSIPKVSYRTGNNNSIGDFHEKLNHLNLADMKKLASGDMVSDITSCNLDKLDGVLNCESCLIGKARKGTPPKKSNHKSTRPGELYHTDLCGPMAVAGINGSLYLMSFTDDFSRYSTVFFLKTKSEAFQTFLNFDTAIYNKFARHVSILRSDNGLEFKNASFSDYCKFYGIEHQFTTPYSPNQNGVSERLNLTIMNPVRAMFISSGLNKNLWEEAVANVVYTRNRSPTSALDSNTTPFELYHGYKPSISHLQSFGSTCFALTNPYQRSFSNFVKLADRSQKCKFLSYSLNSKSYRLLAANDLIIVSRFEDTVFRSTEVPASKGDTQSVIPAPNRHLNQNQFAVLQYIHRWLGCWQLPGCYKC
jgi:transposase InsO family protein